MDAPSQNSGSVEVRPSGPVSNTSAVTSAYAFAYFPLASSDTSCIENTTTDGG